MAQTFTRSIERRVPFKSSTRGLPSREFTFEIGPHGISARAPEFPRRRLSWRDIISLLVIHGRES